jgi:sialic acid synthase SpsE
MASVSTKKPHARSPEIIIGNRVIGAEHAPLVIAEIGINHNGSLQTAFEMVDAACVAGAEVIKHQTHVVDDEMSQAARQVRPGNDPRSIYDIMAACALDEAEEIELKQYVENKGMLFLSTPFSRAAADRLQKMDVVAYKIGSGECNNLPLLRHIAAFGKPMIISTGMNDLDSVRRSVELVESMAVPLALMHTTNLYPTPPELVRLGGMSELMADFPHIPVGLSDHTRNNNACLAAVALGACILERHFTDSKQRSGPDIVNSMDGYELRGLIDGSREIQLMRGGHKQAAAEEKVTSDFAFATVVSINSIAAGEVFTRDNLWVKRPGTGAIAASEYEAILGCRARRDIAADEHIAPGDIHGA